MGRQHRIYLIKCVPNGKAYVGSASLIIQRFSRHRQDLRNRRHSNHHLQNAWNKYGEEAFEFIELECVLSKEHLVAREQAWIDELHPQFNIARIAGSALGVKHSADARLRRSEFFKKYWATHKQIISPETRAKISLAQMGKARVFTDEHIAALSRSATGRKLSAETKMKIGNANRGQKRQFTEEHKAGIKAGWIKRKEKYGIV